MPIRRFLSACKAVALGAVTTMLFAGPFAGASLADTDGFKVAIVLPGVITDRSFNQAGYEGVQRAAEELGIEFAYSEKTAQPDQPQALADYARRGYDLVIGHGGEFQESVSRVAQRFPDTKFLIVNGTEPGGNVATMSFDFAGLGYVMGYVAGRTSETGQAGYVGAQKLLFYVQLGEGFEKGFTAARPDGQVYTAWTNDWDDVAKGKEAALNLISQGADVIFPSMDKAVVGSLQAAKEEGVMGIGIYYDAIADWPDTVIQSAIFDMRSALGEVISKAKTGSIEGTSYIFGLETPAAARIGSYSDRVPSDVEGEVSALIEKIIAGDVETR